MQKAQLNSTGINSWTTAEETTRPHLGGKNEKEWIKKFISMLRSMCVCSLEKETLFRVGNLSNIGGNRIFEKTRTKNPLRSISKI
jgi:hypothetical protein